MNHHAGTAVLLTSDDLIAAQFEKTLSSDGIRIVRAATSMQTWEAITQHRPQVVIVDLATPSMDGDRLLSLSVRALRAAIPLLLLSKTQSRRELSGFAAIVRARDVLCTSESMTNIAARVRMWVASTRAELVPAHDGSALGAAV